MPVCGDAFYFVRFGPRRQPTGIPNLMNTDADLLRRFVDHRSESAFTELVQRYLPLVRSTALRRVGGDTHAVDDITQQVFVTLACKAASLRNHATLGGWLYVTTHHATAELVRREQRRKQREATAQAMHLHDPSDESAAEVARIKPLLDDALITLQPDEREAIVLRFFSGRTFSEIGAAVKLTEEAARKRVHRALEKLQAVLARRGVTSTVAALGGSLTVVGSEIAPAGLAAKVAGVALTKAAVPTVLTTLSGLLWPAAATAVLVGGVLIIAPLHRDNQAAAASIAQMELDTQAGLLALQGENEQLTRKLTSPELAPVPPTQPVRSAQPRSAAKLASPLAPGKTVLITPAGTLKWEDKPVTLDQFLINLADLEATGARDGSRLVVQASGATFSHLTYVLDEARKAGITHLVIESDATPEGITNTWF